ncbi:hypothetical protein KSD_18020 [Ktedonobacter sp. SOSP1-85]|nr:hypothetical protein KSD_18020 [Ktedonobacter sp. SOSP1-85]
MRGNGISHSKNLQPETTDALSETLAREENQNARREEQARLGKHETYAPGLIRESGEQPARLKAYLHGKTV